MKDLIHVFTHDHYPISITGLIEFHDFLMKIKQNALNLQIGLFEFIELSFHWDLFFNELNVWHLIFCLGKLSSFIKSSVNKLYLRNTNETYDVKHYWSNIFLLFFLLFKDIFKQLRLTFYLKFFIWRLFHLRHYKKSHLIFFWS